ncbi:recombination regulator RecX [Microbacterium sp. W1N]|uniref:regulatory protein RecX n=1 Tax=Microbacterium festucae TaxID=2977531 RepID=UPI0021BF6A6F|nr:regulatory protein RecX [Microbacterium festucae]MCT9821497.1 recombination regulator RecX [Microbacterium festucae]
MVRFEVDGGDELAPVTPLFGDRVARGDRADRGVDRADRAGGADRADRADDAAPVSPAASALPVRERVPRAGGAPRPAAGQWHASWLDEAAPAGDPDTAQERDDAERVLMRKLRSRSLSEREARALAAEQGLAPDDVEVLIDRLLRHGYLDDARLAEQLVHTGVDRKAQGRSALAQTLSQRGIPREVTQAALDALPDDDAERALEVARTKVRSVRGLDREVAVRRLVGQLSRRGFGAHALDAARRAIDEQ